MSPRFAKHKEMGHSRKKHDFCESVFNIVLFVLCIAALRNYYQALKKGILLVFFFHSCCIWHSLIMKMCEVKHTCTHRLTTRKCFPPHHSVIPRYYRPHNHSPSWYRTTAPPLSYSAPPLLNSLLHDPFLLDHEEPWTYPQWQAHCYYC